MVHCGSTKVPCNSGGFTRIFKQDFRNQSLLTLSLYSAYALNTAFLKAGSEPAHQRFYENSRFLTISYMNRTALFNWYAL